MAESFEGQKFQDERFAGRVVIDRKLGVKGRYQYSTKDRVYGTLWHVMIVDAKDKGRGFKLGCPVSRPEGSVEVAE